MADIPIIVLAGQSNAALPGVDNRLYELATAQGQAFELVKMTLGGTTLLARAGPDWDPGSTGELFDKLVQVTLAAIARVRASGNTPVVSTLWMQGESDTVEPNASRYQQMLSGFIGAFRSAIGMEHSTFAISLLPDAGKVRDAQLAVVAGGDGVMAIETTGGQRWDIWHYDKATREKIASDFFEAAHISIPDVKYNNHLSGMVYREEGNQIVMRGTSYGDVDWSRPDLNKSANVLTYSGDDRIATGGCNDIIQTGGNNDSVWSNGGDDLIDLGPHDDYGDGGAGNDTIYGQEGNDTLMGSSGADRLFGGLQADKLDGGIGDDVVDGGDGNDVLYGGEGNDVLTGGNGNDLLSGGTGADQMTGGAGDDLYIVDDAADVAIEATAGGIDTVRTTASFSTSDNIENIMLVGNLAINATGSAQDNKITGNEAANAMAGGGGADLLYGYGGADFLDGGASADFLQGGTGLDVLTGGAGADRFLFSGVDLVGMTPQACDTITDFSHADQDRIWLTSITNGKSTLHYTFIGTAEFHRTAGELRYVVADGHATVMGDNNGDGVADFAIRLDGVTELTKGDFLL